MSNAKFHVTDFRCPSCGAEVGAVCRSKKTGKVAPFHSPRLIKAAKAASDL